MILLKIYLDRWPFWDISFGSLNNLNNHVYVNFLDFGFELKQQLKELVFLARLLIAKSMNLSKELLNIWLCCVPTWRSPLKFHSAIYCINFWSLLLVLSIYEQWFRDFFKNIEFHLYHVNYCQNFFVCYFIFSHKLNCSKF